MFYRLSCAILRVVFRMFGGVTCAGLENIPAAGGVILAANHISHVDPPVVGIYVSRQVHYMAKEELFRVPMLGAWMRKVGAFPVRRGTADRKALTRAIEMLKEGKLICIFPEGTRSPDGKLHEPELGIGMIALKSRAPVVPAAVVGSNKVLPPGGKRLYRNPIRIYYGKPLVFEDLYDSADTRRAYEEIGRRIMAAIAELLSRYDS